LVALVIVTSFEKVWIKAVTSSSKVFLASAIAVFEGVPYITFITIVAVTAFVTTIAGNVATRHTDTERFFGAPLTSLNTT
jgi:ABC-type anion transport system duplicated permease subunit